MAADPIRLELKDFHRLRATIERRFAALTPSPVGRAMRSVGEVWMTEAKRRTPVDTGTLRSSGVVIGPEVRGPDQIVRLVFGGPAAPYAAAVHERLEAHHDVGQAKYLESVVVERKGQYAIEVFEMATGGARTHGAIF
jgi:hypothetical protein